MLCWGILVSSIDNVVKPIIISKGGAPLPFIVTMMGVLGGAIAFGFIGVFLGPTLLAIGFQLLAFWTGSRRERVNA
jgi:predicted PurR-regulated permease PerM